MNDSVFAGSPFLRESADVDHRAGGTRSALRVRHDRAATDVRAAGRAGDRTAVIDATRRLEQVLAAARRELGPRDTDTLVVEGSLAVAYLLGDDEIRGLALATRNLTVREVEFGADHPASLAAADAVAAAHRITGDPREAIARYQDVIDRRTRVLGPAHPCTIASCAGLALARADNGDLPGAGSLLAAIADTAEGILGEAHPVTVDVRELLAEASVPDAPVPVPGPAPAPTREAPSTGLLPRMPRMPDPRLSARPWPHLDRPPGPMPAIS
ncbi:MULTISPECIES: tetratricopeptide repeat protein [Pseudonocardia]|nr:MULTISPECIES: tetratricopeptide repeat protein [Pseudonocardia]